MPWTRDVSGLLPSAESDAIIGALDAAGGWGAGDFQMDISITILRADASTPMRPFTPKDAAWAGNPDLAEFWLPDGDVENFPIPATGAIEGETGYACVNDGDCHLIVIHDDARKLFEMWRADITGPATADFLGGASAVWDLTFAYDDTLRGRGCTSADAGGFPIASMLATSDEVYAGEVNHALRFILPNARIRDDIYTPPATHSTGPTSGGPNMPPYGVRFRLKAGFDETSVPAGGPRVLVRALKKYGMFLADGGNIPLTIADDRFMNHTWAESDVDSHVLEVIQVTDFEVVELGELIDWGADSTCYRN